MKVIWLNISIIIVSLYSVAQGQSPVIRLNQKVDAFDSDNKSTVAQLVEVAQRFRVPMGIEWLDTPTERIAPPVHIQNSTVKLLIRHIVEQQPSYDFCLENGTVHVFTKSLVADRRNFLNLRISKFRLEKANMAEARFELWGSIIMTLHPRGGYNGGYGGYSMYKDFDLPKVTLIGRNLTVRQLLSKIVISEGNALWVTRIRPTQMMEGEPYYAQIPSIESGDPAPSFDWEFIALDIHQSN